jgi:hypothetical protein
MNKTRTGEPRRLTNMPDASMTVEYDSLPALLLGEKQRIRVTYGGFFLFCKGMQGYLVEKVVEFDGYLSDFKVSDEVPGEGPTGEVTIVTWTSEQERALTISPNSDTAEN